MTRDEFVSRTGINLTGEPGINLDTVANAPKFQNWFNSIDLAKFKLSEIHIESLNMFGPKVGFLKLRCKVTDPTGKPIAGSIVFIRGDAVGMLFVLVCEGKEYAVTCDQPRLPSGKFHFREIPAGMLDDSKNFSGKAADEIREELHEEVKPEDLVDLTALAGIPEGSYPSVGGCDERLRLYAYVCHVTRDRLNEMQGRETGLAEENEQIRLSIIPLDDVAGLADLKSQTAWALYNRFRHRIPGAPRKGVLRRVWDAIRAH